MEQLRDGVALVTGASSGIGAAIVKDLLQAGLVVVGVARRVERLQQLRNTLTNAAQRERLHAYACDVGDEASVAHVFAEVTQQLGPIRVLINNAGYTETGQLCLLPSQVLQQVLQTNVMGVVNCTRHAFKSMQSLAADVDSDAGSAGVVTGDGCHGHVVLINSIMGHHVPAFPGHLPSLNIYPATKHALTAINEIYRQEFKELGTHIKVTSISPGLVDTEFISEQQKQVCRGMILQPEDVSRAVMFALSAPRHVQIYEVIIKPMGEMV